MKRYKCGIYLRLSKEDDDKVDESTSIESQRMIIESFCKFHDLDIVNEYVDDGFSGGNFDRPAFQRMINDTKEGTINCIITKDLSRLGRELYQTGTFIEEYFVHNDIRYISINDGYDSLNGDNMISMKLTFNDYILRDTSRKVKTSLTARQKRGEYIGSFPKYGYKKDPNDHHHLIIDPVAAQNVKRMFYLALDGMSTHHIAQLFTEEQIPIPIVYKKEPRANLITENDGNGIWRHQTIRNILHSEMYIGNMVQNTYNKVRYNSKKLKAVSEEDYIIVKNTHEPIIDESIFRKVQSMFKTNSNQKKVCRHLKEKFLFSGLLRCHECGHLISISEKINKKDSSHFTECCGYKKKGKYGVCNPHRLNYDILEKDLLDIINNTCEIFLKNYNIETFIDEVSARYKKNIDKNKSDIESLIVEKSKYERAMEKVYLDEKYDYMDKSILKKLLDDYNRKILEAKEQISKLENKNKELENELNNLDFEGCKKIAIKFLDKNKPTKALINELVDRVEIDNNKNIKLYFNYKELVNFNN